MSNFLTLRNIIIGSIVVILAVAIPISVRLAQQPTQLKSTAAACTVGQACGANCGAGGPGQCDDCNGGWCNGGICSTCAAASTCQEDCKFCSAAKDKCGNTVYQGNCDYSTCTSADATYKCTSSGNTNCQGTYRCGNACAPSSGGGNVDTVCKPNTFDPNACAVCNGAGTGYYTEKGKDYGPNTGSAEWCSCAQRYAPDYSTSPTYAVCRTGSGGTGTGATQTSAVDAAECKSVVFKKDGQAVITVTQSSTQGTSLKTGQKYDVEVTMENKDYNNPSYVGPTWTVGDLAKGTGYFLGFPTKGDSGAGNFLVNQDTAGTNLSINSLWQISWQDPTKLRIPLSTTVAANGSHRFEFTATPQAAGLHTFYWGMVHEGVSWFGGQCTPVVNVEGSGCPKAGEDGTTKTCGVDTYDKCVDDKGQTVTTSCSSGATKFRCYWSGDPTRCISGTTATDFNYSCSACTAAATPTPTPSPTRTQCYFYSENLLERDSFGFDDDRWVGCNDPRAIKYDAHPTKLSYPFIDQTPGVKTIFVRFLSNDPNLKPGDPKFNGDVQKSIRFEPKAALTNVNCSYASQGVGTIISITGTNLGAHAQQGSGGLFVRGQKQTTIWSAGQTTINVSLPERIEGEIPIIVKNDDGGSAEGRCTVGLTTLSFETNLQCRKPGQFAAQNVDVKLYENRPGITGIPQPIIAQEITLDSKGIPASFKPKLEVGKIYTLIIKPPQGIARKIDFRALPGTTIIPTPILIPLGDIAPLTQPDGQINTLDNGLMIREWCLVKDCDRVSDLNKDKRVNSIDHSCFLVGARPENNRDDVFESIVLPTPKPTTQATSTPSSAVPSPSLSPSPEPTSSPSPSPTPASGGDNSSSEE